MGLPTIVFVSSLGPTNYLQNPKSATLIIPSCKRIFDGFKSLCKIFSLNKI